MNNLDTNVNGGYPVELDDFRFLDDIYRTGIHQIIQALSSFAILTGCDYGGTDINGDDVLNAGWVVVNGEIGYLPETGGLDLDVLSNSYGIIADNYVDNSVVKITQAGASFKPHEIRQFKLEPYLPAMGEDVRLKNIKQLKETLKTEFGLVDQIKRSYINATPPAFSWNSSLNRWESIIPHNLPLTEFNTQGMSVMIWDLSSSLLVPFIGAYLFENFSYSFDSTNITITDSSSSVSSSASRDFLEANAVKIIFDYL